MGGITALQAKRMADKETKNHGISLDLFAIIANKVTTILGQQGKHSLITRSWCFIYRNGVIIIDEEGKSQVVDESEIGKLDKGEIEKLNGGEIAKEELVFSPEMFLAINSLRRNLPLIEIKIDSDDAMIIAINNGGFVVASGGPFSGGMFLLNVRQIDGDVVPMWLMPYNYKDFLIRGIRADNGEVVYVKDDKRDIWTSTKPPSPVAK